jgi:hypothetical protein
MDVHITDGSPGLPGGNHQLLAEDGPTPAHPMDGSAIDSALPSGAASAAHPAMQERRRSPRFDCPGSVEICISGGDLPLSGMLTNISLHGCFVKTPTTLPLDTSVSLAIDSLGFRIATQAKVRAIYPSTGMGLCFSEIDPEQHAQLELLLKALWAPKHPQR